MTELHQSMAALGFRAGARVARSAAWMVGCALSIVVFAGIWASEARAQTAPAEPAAFADAIDSLLRSDSAELVAARQAFAAEQSWTARFDVIEIELARILMGE